MDVFEWIETNFRPEACTTDRLIYDDMVSQSGRSLPVIYLPFDANQPSHWRDRGSILDFLFSVEGVGKRVLDFGPGDGWPSLLVASYVDEVVGVDGSERRVAVCQENAARMGIRNARFVHVPPGSPLPFESGSFDDIMAASSIEQTPDPCWMLSELYRILRPGGRLRVHYEALNDYRDGHEKDVWLFGLDQERCRLIVYNRDIQAERCIQYGLTIRMPVEEFQRLIPGSETLLAFDHLKEPLLDRIVGLVEEARVSTTQHPSGKTLAAWMQEIGFREVLPTQNGKQAAQEYFDQCPADQRPRDIREVDDLLSPLVRKAIRTPAPLEQDPMITAIK